MDWGKMMSELKLTDRTWGKFSIGDLFQIENCKCSKVSVLKEGNVPYIGATNRNNGVLSFVENKSSFITKGNCIVFICDGEGSIGYSIYKKEDFIGTTTIKVGRNEYLNKYIGQFIVTCSNMMRGKYNFGYKRNEANLKREIIMLPENTDGDPDWQFMEDFIKQKEEKQVTKLKNYYADKALELMISTGNLRNTEWREFSFSQVFAEIQRGKRLIKSNQQDGTTPYVSSTATNNGVDNFIDNSTNVRIFENCLTLANSGSVGSTFFHYYTFVASDHVTALRLEKPNKYIYLFLSGIIKRLEEKYSFNREINDKRIQREKILLPVNEEGLPDWQFMENFMKQIEQDKITAVLNYYKKPFNNNNLRGVETYLLPKNTWSTFAIQDICDIYSGVRLTKQEMINGNLPFIGASDSNNGITAFIANTNASLDRNILGVNYNGSVVENFYHPYECLFSDDVKRLKIKSERVGKYAYLFLKTVILKQKSKYQYGYKFNAERMKKQKILLPVNTDNQPDWENIERYMQQLELEKIVCYLKSKHYS
ncbi:restriction endonuclease subunit S [Glaesserella parasuis]|uniref:restriction endonuclease subunit S n=1 Tax=Glaesserella parasuis TaxID=738 RepID=UPI002436441E|nr:restriction endonuclease subunit S [Glaesserella parasuis]MDG6265566.1 restriction endonuclease subunit S [Glaesserella parasuis]